MAFTTMETVKGQRVPIVPPSYVDDAKINLSENGIKVLEKRYLRRDANGDLLETPAGMFYRVAHVVGSAWPEPSEADAQTRTFYNLMTERRFFPNSPTFTGAGTPLGQLAACFVLPLEDDMGGQEGGIFDTLKNAALIQQTGGGVGFSFSRLRPKDDTVASSGGKATGPLGFLRVYDSAFGEVAQGGTRRGANMGILRCVAGDTLIHTVDQGRVPIENLVGQRPYVYACDSSRKRVRIVQADKVFVSGRNRTMVRVQLDNDTHIDCTPDHRFMLSDGSYVEAGQLKMGDSLMAFKKSIVKHGTSNRHVRTVGCTNGRLEYEHRIVSRDILGSKVSADQHVHHIDGDSMNNSPGNLQVVSRSEHAIAHNDNFVKVRERTAENRKGRTLAEVYGDEKAAEWKAKMSETRKRRFAIENHKVVSVSSIGCHSEVYDISLPLWHNYAANEVFIHNCDHPDIEEFVECKVREGQLSNFNISVGITDKFMRAVEQGSLFDLINPKDGTVWKTIDAGTLFRKIVHYAHKNGEPGMIFLDAANRSNPVPHLYTLEATNPCGEQHLGPYENCCLGSINLAVMFDGLDVDWILLQRTVIESVDFLDSVVTANKYVPAVPELKEAADRSRRIGLGIMGLADLMYKLGVRYGSTMGQDLAAQIMEFVRYWAMRQSIELAKRFGAFPAIKNSIYDFDGSAENFWEAPKSTVPNYPLYSFGRPDLDWSIVRAGIMGFGIRNAAQTTVAPTGTIATVMGCEGYGCEPVFALGYIRHFRDGDKDVELSYVSPLFLEVLNKLPTNTHVAKTWAAQHGTCHDSLPDDIKDIFVVSSDITAEEHVRMQAAMQAFTDNAISKTCNFPEGATEEDVAKAYQLAWELGCKGLTVYITGSRQEVVLETKATQQKKSEGDAPTPRTIEHAKRPRPSVLIGRTHRKQTPAGTAYVTVNSDEHNEPFEVFLNVGKAGSEVAAVSEAIGRLTSLILRLPSTITPTERVSEIVDELAAIGGSRPLGFGNGRVLSLPDGIAQVLRAHMAPTETSIEAPQPAKPHTFGDICPECGEASFLNVEGCRKCFACGYSEC